MKKYKTKHTVIGEGARKQSLVSDLSNLLLLHCPSIKKIVSGKIDASFGNNFRGIRIRPSEENQMRMIYYTNTGKQIFYIFIENGHLQAFQEIQSIQTKIEKLLSGKEVFILDNKD